MEKQGNIVKQLREKQGKMTKLFKKIQRLLQPEGHLFLGSSETLGNNAAGYEQVSHGRFLYYRSQPLSPGGMLGERNLVGSGTLGNER